MVVAAPIVNSSGAVSPAARATASRTPRQDAGKGGGQHDVRIVRAWLDPSAKLASRRSFGHQLEHLLGRADDDRQHQAAEGQGAGEAVDAVDAEAHHPDREDEQAHDDRRHAGHHVGEEPQHATPGGRSCRTRGGRWRRGCRAGRPSAWPTPVMTIVPTIAGPMPGPLRRTGGMSSVNQPEVMTADQPFWITVNEHEAERDERRRRATSPSAPWPGRCGTMRPERFGAQVGRRRRRRVRSRWWSCAPSSSGSSG